MKVKRTCSFDEHLGEKSEENMRFRYALDGTIDRSMQLRPALTENIDRAMQLRPALGDNFDRKCSLEPPWPIKLQRSGQRPAECKTADQH